VRLIDPLRTTALRLAEHAAGAADGFAAMRTLTLKKRIARTLINEVVVDIDAA